MRPTFVWTEIKIFLHWCDDIIAMPTISVPLHHNFLGTLRVLHPCIDSTLWYNIVTFWYTYEEQFFTMWINLYISIHQYTIVPNFWMRHMYSLANNTHFTSVPQDDAPACTHFHISTPQQCSNLSHFTPCLFKDNAPACTFWRCLLPFFDMNAPVVHLLDHWIAHCVLVQNVLPIKHAHS